MLEKLVENTAGNTAATLLSRRVEQMNFLGYVWFAGRAVLEASTSVGLHACR